LQRIAKTSLIEHDPKSKAESEKQVLKHFEGWVIKRREKYWGHLPEEL